MAADLEAFRRCCWHNRFSSHEEHNSHLVDDVCWDGSQAQAMDGGSVSGGSLSLSNGVAVIGVGRFSTSKDVATDDMESLKPHKTLELKVKQLHQLIQQLP